ncbi:putative porin [Trinickia symbiotica]|uniref:Porin n=1 Tax=Trinickia symbiotica TaxID=863227 RepID=A0A2N7X1I0_9BURK|nr:porin [Trinickia symbiotica]PMS35345.1 porin [Trinickia symbiotica]PPK45353.1 putative porin [Trinickia symbiotica]
MKKRVLTTMVAMAVTGLAAGAAHAQSSVTLYGIVDAGLGYINNSSSTGAKTGGAHAFKMLNGVWAGSRFGLKGAEDLGGGTKAIFQLEEGFNSATGAQAVTNLAFNRQAYVGLTNDTYGTLTLGRQYTPYYTLLSPWSPTTWLTGAFGAHPGDIDSLDTSYRTNNAVVYTSPTLYGLTVSGMYALGGVAGSEATDSVWSLAAQYKAGPFGLGVGYQHINNTRTSSAAWNSATANGSGTGIADTSNEPAVSGINNGYKFARAQQRIGVTGGWQFTPNFDISFSYTNVQYLPGAGSGFTNEAVFNTAGAVVHWKAMPTLDLAAGYSYTRKAAADGAGSATYNQFNLSQFYSLSKRTGIYVLEAYQHASGQTLSATSSTTTGATTISVVNATANIGDGIGASTTKNQIAVGAGIIHKF